MGTIAQIFEGPLSSYGFKTSTIPYVFYRTFRIIPLLGTTTKSLKKILHRVLFLGNHL